VAKERASRRTEGVGAAESGSAAVQLRPFSRDLQDVGLVGAAAAGMMMPEMIKAAAMMAAVMKTTMVMLAAIEGADGEDGKSAEVKTA